jgi:FkbM family methyltransferase
MRILESIKRRLARTQLQTIRTGPGAGLIFDPGPSNPAYATGDNELPVQAVLTQHLRKGDVVFDVGANVGFLSVVAAKLVGGSGSVCAFEPVPANAKLVRRNASLNHFDHLTVLETAVGDRAGRARLVVAAYSGGSALASVEAPPDASDEIDVEITTLDRFVQSTGRPPHFVKIDVEGAELLVLQGMHHVCTEHRPTILYELDGASEEALEPKRVACERWLLDHGYRVGELPRSYEDIRWSVRHFLATPEQPRPSC